MQKYDHCEAPKHASTQRRPERPANSFSSMASYKLLDQRIDEVWGFVLGTVPDACVHRQACWSLMPERSRVACTNCWCDPSA